MKPYDAKNVDEVCDHLNCDNKSVGDFWMLVGGEAVTLAKQKRGEKATQCITVPRAAFNKLIDWYMQDQKPPKRKVA